MRSVKALLSSRRTSLGGPHVVNVGFLGSDEDMTTRKAQEPIATATFGKVEGHLPLSVGHSLGRDVAEGRREGTDELLEWVQVTDGIGKLRTDLAHIEGLAKVEVNVGDLIFLEKG